MTVQYDKILAIGYSGLIGEMQAELDKCDPGDGDYCTKSQFLKAAIISCEAVIRYARRYADLAEKEAASCSDAGRRQELLQIAANWCRSMGPPRSMRPARASGLFSSCCSWSPAGIPFPRDVSTSICILIIRRIWKRENCPGNLPRSSSTVSG